MFYIVMPKNLINRSDRKKMTFDCKGLCDFAIGVPVEVKTPIDLNLFEAVLTLFIYI